MLRSSEIHTALHRVETLAGVEMRLAVLSFSVWASLVLALGHPWPLAPAMATHALLRWLTLCDPRIVEVYLRYARQADAYDPWPHVAQTRKRPPGWSSGLLC